MMVNRCIGIDIGGSYISAVQVSRTGEQFHIEEAFSTQIRRSTDSIPDTLRSLVGKYGFDRRAEIAISMPHDDVFFRNLETDFAGLEQIRTSGFSPLEHDFPIQANEIVAQVYSYRQLPGEKYSVLVAATKKPSLHERLSILSAAKIRATLADAPIFAIHAAAMVNHPEIMTGTAIIAYIDENRIILAVTENNDIVMVRNIPTTVHSGSNVDSTQEKLTEVLSYEAGITWQKLFGTAINQDTKIYLVTGGNVPKDIEAIAEEKLRCQVTVVDPCIKVRCSPAFDSKAAISIAEGLALRVLAPERTTGINFLEADGADINPKLDLKKELITCAILVGAIAVVSLIGLFTNLSRLERQYAHIKNEIREVFQRTLPEETNIVSPLVQLEQKLQALRNGHTLSGYVCKPGVEPLELLHQITTSIPLEGNIRINDMLLTDNSLRLRGSSQSFDTVYNWQRRLQQAPQFTIADVQDIRRESKSQSVNFTILLSLATWE